MIFKILGCESIEATMTSVSLSQEENEQIVFRSIWKPLKKSTGPIASRQIDYLKKYQYLLQNKTLKLEDVERSDVDKIGVDYQLLFLHQEGLFRIEFDSIDGEQGRLSHMVYFCQSKSLRVFSLILNS